MIERWLVYGQKGKKVGKETNFDFIGFHFAFVCYVCECGRKKTLKPNNTSKHFGLILNALTNHEGTF